MKKILLSLLLFFTGTAFGQDTIDFAHVQLYPTSKYYAITEAQAAELENALRPIIADFMEQLNMTVPRVRWTVYVLDELGQNTPALVTYWSSGQQWVVVFHFRYADVIALTQVGRRVLAAHEVGHLTGRCMVLTTKELQEICADVISAELTSAAQVLALLRYYRPQYTNNELLDERIAVMENLLKIESLRESTIPTEEEGPTLLESEE